MSVLRIVASFAASSVDEVAKFYIELFDLDSLMDFGWITTLGAHTTSRAQFSIMTEGGAGAPVPAISIEVDDVDAIHIHAVEMDLMVEYPLTDEPWGARRFFVRDPAGTLINILAHSG